MKYTKISSPANPLIKDALKMKQRRSGSRHEAFLIEGPNLVEMAAASPLVEISRVFFTGEYASKKDGSEILKKLGGKSSLFAEIPVQILSKIAETDSPQGIVAVGAYKPVAFGEIVIKDVPLLVICDGIQDPGNLGTIIRVSDAVNADAVIILPGTCDAFNSKAVRATAGSLFNIPVVYAETDALVAYLRSKHIKLYVADVHSDKSLYEADFRQPAAIALGNEAHGVSEGILKNADDLLKIPIIGKAESLNVATAASVCLYEALRQRNFGLGPVGR